MEDKGQINSVSDLKVYRKAFDAAMEIYEISKGFPKEELYSLTDQIRLIRSADKNSSLFLAERSSLFPLSLSPLYLLNSLVNKQHRRPE